MTDHPFQIAYREALAECEAWFARNEGTGAWRSVRYPGFAWTVFECRDFIRRLG